MITKDSMPALRDGFSRRWVTASKLEERKAHGFEFVSDGDVTVTRAAGTNADGSRMIQYLMEIDNGMRRREQARRMPAPESTYTTYLHADAWRWWRLIHWASETMPFIGVVNWYLLRGRYFRVVFKPVAFWSLVMRVSWQPRWKWEAFAEWAPGDRFGLVKFIRYSVPINATLAAFMICAAVVYAGNLAALCAMMALLLSLQLARNVRWLRIYD